MRDGRLAVVASGEASSGFVDGDIRTQYVLLGQPPGEVGHPAGSPRPRIERIGAFTFAAQLADDFRRGRVFLIGDAAHRVPPRGGTGMNTAIHDGYDLGWKLRWVLCGRRPGRCVAGRLRSWIRVACRGPGGPRRSL